ncbi:ankyrin repeat-containing domain protein, partial [Pelagophyceae sp. CCMP2097]
VKLLCDAGGDAQLPDAGGLTPLHIASRNGRAKVVEALLRHGVDADARDTIGWTALHWACHRGEAGVAAML